MEGEWQEFDLGVAEQLDEYWDRLQGLASGPESEDDVLRSFPFSHVREVLHGARLSRNSGTHGEPQKSRTPKWPAPRQATTCCAPSPLSHRRGAAPKANSETLIK